MKSPASLGETQRGLVQHQAVQAPGAGLDRLQEGLAIPVLLELVVGSGKVCCTSWDEVCCGMIARLLFIAPPTANDRTESSRAGIRSNRAAPHRQVECLSWWIFCTAVTAGSTAVGVLVRMHYAQHYLKIGDHGLCLRMQNPPSPSITATGRDCSGFY